MNTVKGMYAWVDYVAAELNIVKERTPWGSRYMIPPETGTGYMESFEAPGQWVVWRSDFMINKAMDTSYVQEDPYYMAFVYREASFTDRTQDMTWSSDKIVDFRCPSGLTMKAVGTYFYTTYFDGISGKEISDFIASIQSYDDNALMKQLTPILHQMQAHPGTGLALKLFMESRMLEIASILIDVSEQERQDKRITLSAFDAGQLHKVIEILEARLADPPTIGELARMVALNEFKLKAGFRQLFGTTIFEYLRLLRMEKAAELLQGRALSPAEAGRRVGYTTPHGFNNAFRKYYGMTPAQWQNRRL